MAMRDAVEHQADERAATSRRASRPARSWASGASRPRGGGLRAAVAVAWRAMAPVMHRSGLRSIANCGTVACMTAHRVRVPDGRPARRGCRPAARLPSPSPTGCGCWSPTGGSRPAPGCPASATSPTRSASAAPPSPARTPRCATAATSTPARARGRSPGCRRTEPPGDDRVLLPGHGRPTADRPDLRRGRAPRPAWSTAYERGRGAAPGATSPAPATSPLGLPALREVIAERVRPRAACRPTPDQIIVTAGRAGRHRAWPRGRSLGPGDRVAHRDARPTPTPSTPCAARAPGWSPLPVDPHGWDRRGARPRTVRQAAPRLAYLIPDFHNPTGALMDDDAARGGGRGAAPAPARSPIVDETIVELDLDGAADAARRSPRTPRTRSPSAAPARRSGAGCGSAGCAPRTHRIGALVAARLTLDLGAPVLEQLVLAGCSPTASRCSPTSGARLRERRDALAAALSGPLPDWRFRVPRGGLALWCELPDGRFQPRSPSPPSGRA